MTIMRMMMIMTLIIITMSIRSMPLPMLIDHGFSLELDFDSVLRYWAYNGENK